ncbi:caspase family protein [Janthinobacterium sp. Mn2066]|uniref:caspase family protein n=1 Tax=Janthinobacterium sp. Mn2066 TaxID=3395264 RepID=UPI003BE2591B
MTLRWLRGWWLACLLGGTALAGERHALLVGVAELPAMPRSTWLAGPTSDVAAMRAALLRHGFAADHIDSFSDAGGAVPTRAAILARLAQLENTLGKDDVLLLYWSGHSVLLPTHPGLAPAPAGRHTMLLTRDSKVQGRRLDGGIGSSELGRAIDALSARQARVVAIFDTCHAAAGTRGGDGLVWRGLSTTDIGWRAPASAADAGPRARPHFIGFFAAEAQQRTPESAVQATGQAAGLFTRAVISGLDAQPRTYAIWADNATQQYRAALDSYHLPRSAWPSPVYTGTLDTPLWAGGSASASPRWPVRRDGQGWYLPFGLLDGLRDGDVFQNDGARWRAVATGWGESRLSLIAGSDATTPGWASRTAQSPARLAQLLALPATPGTPLLDARIELSLPGQPPRQLPFADADLGLLPAGTRIRLSVENRSTASVDLALAHLPLDGPAMRIYPALEGDSNRMPPAIGNGISRFERSFVVSGPRFGKEWLALIAAPAGNGTLPRRFFLLDTPAPATRGARTDLDDAHNPDQAQVARLSWTSTK